MGRDVPRRSQLAVYTLLAIETVVRRRADMRSIEGRAPTLFLISSRRHRMPLLVQANTDCTSAYRQNHHLNFGGTSTLSSIASALRHRANHRLAETRKENVQFLVHQKCVYLRQDAFALVVHGQTQCIRAKYPTIVNSATAAAMTPRAQTSGPAARCPYLTFTAYVLGRSMVIALSPEIFGSH
jgi:hypothetical protein